MFLPFASCFPSYLAMLSEYMYYIDKRISTQKFFVHKVMIDWQNCCDKFNYKGSICEWWLFLTKTNTSCIDGMAKTYNNSQFRQNRNHHSKKDKNNISACNMSYFDRSWCRPKKLNIQKRILTQVAPTQAFVQKWLNASAASGPVSYHLILSPSKK